MSDNVFLDTNILVYLFSIDEPDKREAALLIINKTPSITGINNINELTNVLIKKFKIPYDDVINAIEQVSQSVKVVDIGIGTIKYAVQIAKKYNYSYYDSLAIATALINQCTHLYTEDMQHQQVIENNLTITNIFKV